MNDNTSSLNPIFDEINDDSITDSSTAESPEVSVLSIDSRRRLEDKLEQRYLEKDIREFDFDL